MSVEPAIGCHSDDVPGQPQRAGLGQEACKSKRFFTKKVGTKVNPSDLMMNPLPGPMIVELIRLMSYKFVGQSSSQGELYGMRLVGGLTDVKEKAESLAAATAKWDLRKCTVVQLVLIWKAEFGCFTRNCVDIPEAAFCMVRL